MNGIAIVDTVRSFVRTQFLSSKALLSASFAAAPIFALAPAALGDETQLPPPDSEVILTIAGQITRTNLEFRAVFDETMLSGLPSTTLETTTAVTDGVKRFDGFLMRDLLAHVGAEGQTVTATALNDYVVNIPIEDFERFDVLVATHMDGEPLLPSDKGPLWIVYPRDNQAELQDIRYDYRWVWQLVRLDVE